MPTTHSKRLYLPVFFAFLLSAGPVLDVHADSSTYQTTLKSTAWVITSNADNETSTGTGVYIDSEKKLLLTNAHVVGDSRKAVIFFPARENGKLVVRRKHYLTNILKLGIQGDVVAVDRKRDLALIQLPKVPGDVTAVELAEDSTTPGSQVDLIGNPGDSDILWVYTSGTVRSVYQKKFKSTHGEHDFMAVETQSPIKPGDSGGPIVDESGKLVGLAQSFSPQSPLISFCVDVTEIRRLLQSPWRSAPLASKVLLDEAEIKYTKHSSGHYQIDQQVGKETQSVFVAKNTEYHGRADIRRIWSTVQTTTEAPDAVLMMRLLRQNTATKIGSWAIEKTDEGYVVFFVAKLDATASDETLSSTIDYVARLAAAMATDLKPKETEKTAQATLAAWLSE
ncbi:trypsin-like peptidase domain-containing protein [Roseiconus nitratireducens]|uniref:Trypsin-like peptidase domain-containing protein n=1 Tax=Roseiconus nitratireducens TaxID=2605748 RepID=A0A5M6DFA2_9BACT|nr:serine protease [Roseiconus nitratireducens]KAA5543875.1 trypsin-like peptidase domain-containing protein [Roseiconus nitratireducens]